MFLNNVYNTWERRKIVKPEKGGEATCGALSYYPIDSAGHCYQNNEMKILIIKVW